VGRGKHLVLARGHIYLSERIVRWEPTTHNARDVQKIGAKAWIHQASEACCILHRRETVVDARELDISI
jgi:hypothetical protein